MYELITSAFNGYTISYRGIPSLCWHRIVISLMVAIVSGFIFFFSLYFVSILHFTVEKAGIMMACYGIGTAIGGLLGGKLSDKITPSIVSTIALLIMAIAFLILGAITAPVTLALCLFCIGLSAYAFITSNTLWILNYCKIEAIRNKAINIIYVTLNLGIGVGAFLVSLLSKHGFIILFHLATLLLLLSAIYLFLLRIFTKNHIHTREILNDQHETASEQQKRRNVAVVVLACVFLAGFFIAQISTTYPIYIHDKFYHLGIKAVGILFILSAALIVLFQAPINYRLSKYNKLLLLGLGLFLMGFGILLLSFAFTYFIVIIACIIQTLGDILFFATAQFVCYQLGISSRKGHSIGLYRSVYASSLIVGPAVGGFIYDRSSGDLLWVICGIIGLIGLIACLRYKNLYATIITK